ncbi:hypothetical protein [Actinoplanes palleronii]|uniref:Secreted protein n=1 Tax=Actinoplanes palleronii TaxID=113570 RepID=A0ABQ4BPN4_9ACTN|nr:hypothetical protein [Actinoplanes palleronii]GIE72633.1 hypothetical protein Apa02nite_087410 [Actinoplanes palleronii]
MTHPQPTSRAAWPLRWLLVVLTLTGLGLLQGAHCGATHPPHLGASTDDRLGTTAHAGFAAGNDVTHGDHPGGAERPASGATTEDCDAEARTTTFTIVSAAAVHPPVTITRIGATRPRPAPPRPRPVSAATLSQLGISRI